MRILGTLRGKIIAGTAIMMGVVGAATFSTGLASFELARSVELLFRDNLVIEEVGKGLAATEAGLAGYLGSKSSDSLKEYIKESTRLAERVRLLNRSARQDEVLLLERELAGLADRYLEDAEGAVAAKRGRDIVAYTRHYEDSERSAELARLLIGRIEGINLAASLAAFTAFNARIPAVIASNAVLALAAVLMAFMLFVRWSYAVTGPLSALAEAARGVGEGDYGRSLPGPESADEIATTAAAFASMRESVQRAFEELRSKAEVEKRLMEERVRLLDLDHKLKDAELLALQSQINPHFLFNTLSAGMQLALAEGAERTGDFMEKLAGFIRYALRSPSRQVLVADEIECVERYVWLLRLRFGERYAFRIEAEDEVLGAGSPALVLQPLVENAVAHGLHDLEAGGSVRISAALRGGDAVLEVADTGVGMGEAELARVLAESPSADEALHEGGIGLKNVIRRVSLATGGMGRVEIESSPGRGTTVRVLLPAGEARA